MVKRILNSISKYLLLLLFISYYVNISCFPHVHVINGVTIAHSHFYKGKASGGQANHSHNATYVQLIALSSQFVATGDAPQTFAICEPPVCFEIKSLIPDVQLLPACFLGKLHLRAPPVC
jgi:hypothetical protein